MPVLRGRRDGRVAVQIETLPLNMDARTTLHEKRSGRRLLQTDDVMSCHPASLEMQHILTRTEMASQILTLNQTLFSSRIRQRLRDSRYRACLTDAFLF